MANGKPCLDQDESVRVGNMPQRTNGFQQLVHMIQMAFAPTGAKVTESAMESEGEIDVLIEVTVGPYLLKIAVEAKDTKRPLDLPEINQMIGRYKTIGGQPIDKLVVVSRNGYSKRARERAVEANIELFILNEVTQSDWTKLVPQKLFFQIAPYISEVELFPTIPDRGNQSAVHNGRLFCTCHGHDKGSPLQWAEWLFRNQVLGNPILLERMRGEAKLRGGCCGATIPLPLVNRVLRLQGYDYPVGELRIQVTLVHADNDIEWSSFSYKGQDGTDRTVDQFESSIAGSKLKVLFPDGANSSNLSLRFDKDHKPPASVPEPPASTLCIDTIHAPFCPKHYPYARVIASTNNVRSKKKAAPKTKNSDFPKKGVGRNTPCPCGSGRKHKACCLKTQ